MHSVGYNKYMLIQNYGYVRKWRQTFLTFGQRTAPCAYYKYHNRNSKRESSQYAAQLPTTFGLSPTALYFLPAEAHTIVRSVATAAQRQLLSRHTECTWRFLHLPKEPPTQRCIRPFEKCQQYTGRNAKQGETHWSAQFLRKHAATPALH